MKKILQSDFIKKLIYLIFFAFAFTSCKKLIEIPPNPTNQIATKQVFADSASMVSAVAAVYNDFAVTSASLQFHSGSITTTTGLAGDELQTSLNNSDLISLFNNNIVTNNGTVSSMWTQAYSNLYQVNACLEGIRTSSAVSPGTKNQLIGEIEVVRALYYFNMVNLFKGIPLVLSTAYATNAKLPRTTEDAVYEQIIKDLTDAKLKLTAAYPSDGRARPNLYVATALLAKIFLYRGKWADAEKMASEVIKSHAYELEQDLTNVFLEGSNEAIWQIPAIGLFSQTAEGYSLVPSSSNVVPPYFLTSFLLNSFEAGDLRKDSWLGINEVKINGNDVSYYYPAKYKNRFNDDFPEEGYIVLRLAEQYLIRAEALARQGNITGALADLNEIRNPDRVGLDEYAGPNDQTSVVKAIMQERQTELFCEWGNRWFDLKRTGTADQILGTEKPNWKAHAALYPIPLNEIQKNPFLTQNQGY